MKQFTLKTIQVQDLINFFNGLTPDEIAKEKTDAPMKHITRVQKLIEELEKQNAAFVALTEKYNAPIVKAMEAARAKYQAYIAATPDATAEDKKMKETELVTASGISDISKEQNEKLKYEETGLKNMTVKIDSDERFEVLKSLFEKLAPTKFTQKKALTEIWEAVETAKEA